VGLGPATCTPTNSPGDFIVTWFDDCCFLSWQVLEKNPQSTPSVFLVMPEIPPLVSSELTCHLSRDCYRTRATSGSQPEPPEEPGLQHSQVLVTSLL
jgi:hypothetical protein